MKMRKRFLSGLLITLLGVFVLIFTLSAFYSSWFFSADTTSYPIRQFDQKDPYQKGINILSYQGRNYLEVYDQTTINNAFDTTQVDTSVPPAYIFSYYVGSGGSDNLGTPYPMAVVALGDSTYYSQFENVGTSSPAFYLLKYGVSQSKSTIFDNLNQTKTILNNALTAYQKVALTKDPDYVIKDNVLYNKSYAFKYEITTGTFSDSNVSVENFPFTSTSAQESESAEDETGVKSLAVSVDGSYSSPSKNALSYKILTNALTQAQTLASINGQESQNQKDAEVITAAIRTYESDINSNNGSDDNGSIDVSIPDVTWNDENPDDNSSTSGDTTEETNTVNNNNDQNSTKYVVSFNLEIEKHGDGTSPGVYITIVGDGTDISNVSYINVYSCSNSNNSSCSFLDRRNVASSQIDGSPVYWDTGGWAAGTYRILAKAFSSNGTFTGIQAEGSVTIAGSGTNTSVTSTTGGSSKNTGSTSTTDSTGIVTTGLGDNSDLTAPSDVDVRTTLVKSTVTNIKGILSKVGTPIMALLAALAIVFLTIAGMKYITSGGDTAKAEVAKKAILYSVYGIVIAIISVYVVRTTINEILTMVGKTRISADTEATLGATAGNATGATATLNGVMHYAWQIIHILMMWSQAVAVVYILLGAFFYITSGGDDAKAENGKKTITWAVIGMILVITADYLLQLYTGIFS